MKKLIPIISLLFIGVALITCCHEPDPDSGACGEATSIDEMKEWIFFKTGTYWIYQEETTGELDTMSVVSHGEGIHEGTNYRWFSYDVISSRDGWKYWWWFSESYSSNCPNRKYCYCNKVYCSKSMPGDFFGEDKMFVFPLHEGNWIGIEGGNSGGLTQVTGVDSIIEILQPPSSISIVDFHIDHSVCDNWHPADYSISKNYGIVKKRTPDIAENWRLKAAYIIQ